MQLSLFLKVTVTFVGGNQEITSETLETKSFHIMGPYGSPEAYAARLWWCQPPFRPVPPHTIAAAVAMVIVFKVSRFEKC